MTRVLYFGSRAWVDVPRDWTARETHRYIRAHGRPAILGERYYVIRNRMLEDVASLGRITVIEGEADGADILSRIVAVRLEQSHDPYPGDTRIDGPWPAAGHRRNARMERDGKPQEARGFIVGTCGTPLSKGSAGMVEILRRKGIPFILHRDDGIEAT